MEAVQVVVDVARGLLLIAELALLVPLLYLALLSVAALFAAHRMRRMRRAALSPEQAGASAPPVRTLPRFAILIPAHDEAAVIAGAVTSATALDYPADRRDGLRAHGRPESRQGLRAGLAAGAARSRRSPL